MDVGIVESRERENGKDVRKAYEIDFVATLGNKRYYIQSAYEIPSEGKWLQETISFDRVADSFKKIVLKKNLSYLTTMKNVISSLDCSISF